MKKCLILPLLFMAFVAFAQPKIHSITSFQIGKEKQKTVQLFDYQDNGLTVRWQNWDYKRVDSTPILWEVSQQRFRREGQLIFQESKYLFQDTWYNRPRTDNTYTADGCLIESKNTDFDIYNRESLVTVSSIQTNAKCQYLLDTTVSFKRNYVTNQLQLDSLYHISRIEYGNNDSIKAVRYYTQNRIRPTFLQQIRAIEYTRRPDGKVVGIYEVFPRQDDLGYEKYTSIEYNAKGQIVMKNIVHLGFGSSKDSIIYSYNSEGQLTTEVRFHYEWRFDKLNNKFTTDYAYYCDGLLKSKTTTPSNTSYTYTTKEIYTYTEGATCDKKDLIDFTIAPNPTSFQAIISAEGLSSADYTLTIYSSAGALIHTYKVDFRTTNFDFSTANLASGTYLVRLTNDKNSVSKKLVVVH